MPIAQDYLTISPTLLKELKASKEEVKQKLDAAEAKKLNLTKVRQAPCGDEENMPLPHLSTVFPVQMTLDEKQFRWMLNEDAMATEKLSEGIRKFAADQVCQNKTDMVWLEATLSLLLTPLFGSIHPHLLSVIGQA